MQSYAIRPVATPIDELRGRASELEEATAGEPSLEVSESRLEEKLVINDRGKMVNRVLNQ
jgi:hypothetical protein